jgi:hypothetical protein
MKYRRRCDPKLDGFDGIEGVETALKSFDELRA